MSRDSSRRIRAFAAGREVLDEIRKARALADEIDTILTPRIVVCPKCGVPFTRTGAALSSGFYRTAEENDTCIVCREGLDPVTLEPLAAEEEPMEKPARLTDAELVERLELAATCTRLALLRNIRAAADVLAGLGLEAAARIRARGRDALRERASRLEDAAFHFQTCSTCRREGQGACSSGQRFAAYLRGEELEEGASHAG